MRLTNILPKCKINKYKCKTGVCGSAPAQFCYGSNQSMKRHKFKILSLAAVFALIIFSAAMLMGSGNAAFFSFGPLLPGIAAKLGMPAYSLVLPLQLSASMGRAASPIAGIIVAIAGVAGVSPLELARRNTLPLIGSILFLIFYHFITL